MDKILFKQEAKIDLICIGRLGVDLNCDDVNCPLKDVKSFHPTVGGSPANIAIGSSKQGIKVGVISKISSDAIGEYVIAELNEYGVDTSNVSKDENGAKNCLAITEIKAPNQCGGILYRDNVADLNLTYGDISEEYIKSAKAILVSGTALSASPSREAVLLAIKYAKKHGTKVIMDIDYRPYSWASMEETSFYTSMACEACDIIIGTREEFDVVEYLYDKDNIDDEVSAKRWLNEKTEIVVVKRGEDGSTAWTNEGDEISHPIYPAQLKKTFGAGDAYASGFISALIKGEDILTAMGNGSASATIVVSGYDCSKTSPTTEELAEYRRTHKTK
jgi:5-dehydro-2-deoxygluconokinase